MNDIAIQIDNVCKEYRLGAIGGATLREDVNRWLAKLRGKEDPYLRIGQKQHLHNEKFMALDGVSMTVRKGERVGIIGHNGAGKSTLLKLLSRVTAPTSGSISYNGRISSMLEVGTGFHGELTGRENIFMNGAILGMTKKEIERKLDDIIAFAEMEQFIDTPVKRYSSGMYVKLAFAIAAHLDNDILVMDEVLAVGDMKFQQKCLGKMNDVSSQDGKTVLYVSHNMNTIRQLCERCIVLDHGHVIFDGDVETSVDLYLGDANRNKQNHIVTDKLPRPEYCSGKLHIESIDIENKDCIVNAEKSIFSFYLNVAAKEKMKNVFIRFFVQDNKNTHIGNFTTKLYDVEQIGDVRWKFELDMSALISGTYSLRICINTRTLTGIQNIDDLNQLCYFDKLYDSTKLMAEYKRDLHGYFDFGAPQMEI